MKKLILIPFIIIILFMSGGKPVSDGKLKLYKEIENLKQQGVATRFIDNETVELTQGLSGFQRIKSLKDPDEAAINAWIAADSIPLLEIDPALIDTNQFAGWYQYWTTVPLSNAFGYPLLVGDIDKNGKPDVYGIYKDTTSYEFESHIYEIDTSGKIILRYKYVPRRGPSRQFVDVDKNGLLEVVFMYGDSSFFYEQQSGVSLPTRRKFAHAKWEYPGTAISGIETVIEMDNDSLIDFVYRGSIPDTNQSGYQYYAFVAEYDTSINNFQKVWKTQFTSPYGNVSGGNGYDVGDYDNDRKMNFLASYIYGQIWVVENIGNNSYEINWTDSTPFVNQYYKTSGDVDSDGKREFFVSATMSNGNWITVYEADSNDHYSPTFLFHLFSGGSLDEPTLMTTDVDGDGKIEFVILSGADLFIFKSDHDNNYRLWYYKLNDAKESIQFYDFNGDSRKDFIISKSRVNNSGFLYHYADVFIADLVNSVVDTTIYSLPKNFHLFQNYPNPFNPKTRIRYVLNERNNITLKILDVLGREIVTLVNELKQPGEYTINWEAANIPSGIYFYRLTLGNEQNRMQVQTKKMILIK